MVEPATGVSGALGALQGVRPPTAGGDSGSLTGAAQELSSAARGLQSVQGQIAGQTMAISQMSIAGQVQTQQMAMLIGQLNMSVGQLIGAINSLAGATRATAMTQPTFSPAMVGFGMGAMSGFGGRTSDMAMNAARTGGGLFSSAARGIGSVAGFAGAPFVAGSFAGPQPGQLYGSVGNAGMMRSAFMGAGITDLSRVGQQQSNAAEVQRLAADRGAFKMGEIMLGAGTGLMGFGANQLGGSIGSAIGGRVLGGGIGNLVGGVVGGGVIGAALMAPVTQTLDQIGAIRGTGEMLGRNAFRFSGAGADRPGFRERSRFGAGMLSDATSDLMFSNSDMQQMFSGAIENDLMRGVSGSQQARQRMRQLKDSVKIIGQTLGTTIQESMQLMGDLQSVGIGPQAATRAMMGSNVTGLTRQEALQGQMSFMGRFAGTGFQGQGLMNLAAQSQQIGQVAMRQGMLSPEQIAAAGGRAGVNQVYGQSMMALMQGGLGTLNMAARMGSGSFGGVSGNPLAAMMQAGGAATSGNLISFAANRGQNMRDMLNDPVSQARILQQVAGIADQFKGMGNRDDIVKLILKQQGVEDPSVFMNLLKAQPQALREQMLVQQRALAEMQIAQATENFSITGRIGRMAQSVTLPLAADISSTVAGVQDRATSAMSDVRDFILGTRPVPLSSGAVSVENLRKLKPAGISDKRQKVIGARPTEEQLSRARGMARTAAARISETGLGGKIRKFREETNPERRRDLAKILLGQLSGGDAFRSDDPALQKAYEQALSEQFGIDLSSALNGAPGGLSREERERMDSAMGDVRDILGGGASKDHVMRLSQNDAVKKYLAAAQGNDTVALAAARGSMIESLGDDTLSNMLIDASMSPQSAGKLSQRLADFSDLGGREGMSLALARGGDVLANSVREAGGLMGRFGAAGSIAGSLSGGTREGVQAALRQLQSLDNEKRADLLAKAGFAGTVLDTASKVKENMGLDQLVKAGVEENLARNVLGGRTTLGAEGVRELQDLLVARVGAGGDGGATVAVRGGFTQAQLAEQAKIAELLARTAETVLAIESGLRASGVNIAARAKP